MHDNNANFKLFGNDESIIWYQYLTRDGQYNSRFLTEKEISQGNIINQLMYLAKNGKLCNITYLDSIDNRVIIDECKVIFYNPTRDRFKVENFQGEYELQEANITDIMII